MLDLIKIGQMIEHHRVSKQLTQDDLAKELFVSPQAVSKWERGLNLPSIESLIALTTLFNLSIDELLCHVDFNTDIEHLLNQHNRAYIIQSIIVGKIQLELKDYFYLLSKEERQAVLSHIVSNNMTCDLNTSWFYLSKPERFYLLTQLPLPKLTEYIHVLSNDEMQIVKKRRQTKGEYYYENK